jgi:protein-S-isoprenylcysteine O-methyltransferase Ste14
MPQLASATSLRSELRERLLSLFPASPKAVMLNYLSAAALLLLGYAFFLTVPPYRALFSPAGEVALRFTLAAYLIFLPIVYATFPDGQATKCRLFWRAFLSLPKRRPTPRQALALRTIAVKAFFLPLMINWFVTHMAALLVGLRTFTSANDWTTALYLLVLTVMVVVDTLVFSIAFGVEHPRLGNEVRSVDATPLGWMSALFCYPPLMLLLARAFGIAGADVPAFETPWLQLPAMVAMLTLLGVHTWASVVLGLKSGNLMNRGIVTTGPYAIVRHPAYVAIITFGLIGGVSLLAAAGATLHATGLLLYGVAGWSGMYVLRALTEERHLSADPEYQAYCRRVRYRFIPGVW